MTVAEIDQKIADLTAEHTGNAELILQAESLKKRQREVTKELASLYREKARASIAELRAGK